MPYKSNPPRAPGRTYAEAGHLALPPLVLPVDLPIADADNHENAEENEAPVSNFYRSHVPRASNRLFDVRTQNGFGSPIGRVDVESKTTVP